METNFPPAEQARACLHCNWWKARNSVVGACKRMPPNRDDDGEGFWPMTGRADWCGEFQNKGT